MDISKESEDEAIEMSMRWYIAKTFEKTSHEYNPKKVSKSPEGVNDYYGKAIGRIPIWALKPEQYNHKIIRAYFTALDIAGSATISMMEQLCSEKVYPKLYVPTFKVFEDDGENVWLWSEIEDTLLKHKSSFYSGEDKNE